MQGDAWTIVIPGAIVALITYALPKVIEGVFRRNVTTTEAEAAQENIEAMRWQKAQDDMRELRAENARLRKLLINHRIDPNDTIEFELPKKSGFGK